MNTANHGTCMGKPIQTPFLIPVRHASTPTCIHTPFMINGKAHFLTCVGMHAPYGGLLAENVEHMDISLLGPALSAHVLFPKGADILFIQVRDPSHILVRLWQRNAGEAVLTPNAACAAFMIAKMLQKVHLEAEVTDGKQAFIVDYNTTDEQLYLSHPFATLTAG